MKPKMDDFVSVMSPTGEIDRYGKYLTTEIISTARVVPLVKTVETGDGNRAEVSAEIDLPKEVVVGYGTKIKFKDQFEVWKEGNVIILEPSLDLGNHVLFWTVLVG